LSQTDERRGSSESRWRKYVHKEMPCTCVQRNLYMRPFYAHMCLYTIYLFFGEASSIWQHWL